MSTKRVDGPTPSGGDYSVATFVNLETMEEVDEVTATGIVVAEYTADGRWICETVASASPSG